VNVKRLFRIVTPLLGCSLLLAAPVFSPSAKASEAGPAEGVALVIVYDTSGSMLQSVPDAGGKPAPKHVVAHRALGAVVDRLQAVASGSGTSRVPLEAGLIIFRGTATPFAIKFGAFDPDVFRKWLKNPAKCEAGTPLGSAVQLAGETVLRAPAARKHVLVITDGENTQGRDPARTIPEVQKDAEFRQARVSFHFVAFDVNAKVFDVVKKLGATVVGAADEKQLNSQLEFILEKKILLEDEEVPAPPTKTN
jgi:hypothetical protein